MKEFVNCYCNKDEPLVYKLTNCKNLVEMKRLL